MSFYQGHSQEFVKGGSHCAKERALRIILPCRFRQLFVGCLSKKRFQTGISPLHPPPATPLVSIENVSNVAECECFKQFKALNPSIFLHEFEFELHLDL